MNAPKPVVQRLADIVNYQKGTVVSKMLLKQKTGSATLFAFARGEGLSEHTTPFEALLYLVEGMAEVLIAGETYVLAGGDIILLPARIPHEVRAVDDFKMMLIMMKPV